MRVLFVDALRALDLAETDGDNLAVLRALGDIGEMREEARVFFVRRVRQQGVSWAVIGDALRMPRQQAWRRYKELDGAAECESPK